MLVYFGIIGLICLDFIVEHLLRSNNILSENYQGKGFRIKILNFVFKYRLITICTLVFFSTFKSLNVGCDTHTYFSYYKEMINDHKKMFIMPIGNMFEFSYTFLTSILALMNLPFRCLLFIVATFVSITIVMFVNKVSVNKFMSIMLYIALGTFAQSLNAYRQIIAIAFILLAIVMIIDKKWIKASILILVASTFHISAILCLIIIPLRFIKPKWWLVASAFAISIVGAFAFPHVLKLIDKFTFLDYYSKYFIDNTKYLNSRSLIDTLYSIALILVFMVMYISRFKLLKLDDKDKVVYDFFLLVFMFVPLFRIVGMIAQIPELLNRLTMYFFVALIVLIPLFVKGFSWNKKMCIALNIVVYVVAIVYMYYLYAIKLSCGVVPYAFFF